MYGTPPPGRCWRRLPLKAYKPGAVCETGHAQGKGMAGERPQFKTKAEWAAAQAADMRARAADLRYQSSAGSASKARRKFEQIDHLHREASRFDAIAERLRRSGR